MTRCPACQLETISFRAWLASTLGSPAVCSSCGGKFRSDLRRLRLPFVASVLAVAAFFALTSYAGSLTSVSLPAVFGLLMANLAMIASALWLLVAVVRQPLTQT